MSIYPYEKNPWLMDVDGPAEQHSPENAMAFLATSAWADSGRAEPSPPHSADAQNDAPAVTLPFTDTSRTNDKGTEAPAPTRHRLPTTAASFGLSAQGSWSQKQDEGWTDTASSALGAWAQAPHAWQAPQAFANSDLHCPEVSQAPSNDAPGGKAVAHTQRPKPVVNLPMPSSERNSRETGERSSGYSAKRRIIETQSPNGSRLSSNEIRLAREVQRQRHRDREMQAEKNDLEAKLAETERLLAETRERRPAAAGLQQNGRMDKEMEQRPRTQASQSSRAAQEGEAPERTSSDRREARVGKARSREERSPRRSTRGSAVDRKEKMGAKTRNSGKQLCIVFERPRKPRSGGTVAKEDPSTKGKDSARRRPEVDKQTDSSESDSETSEHLGTVGSDGETHSRSRMRHARTKGRGPIESRTSKRQKASMSKKRVQIGRRPEHLLEDEIASVSREERNIHTSIVRAIVQEEFGVRTDEGFIGRELPDPSDITKHQTGAAGPNAKELIWDMTQNGKSAWNKAVIMILAEAAERVVSEHNETTGARDRIKPMSLPYWKDLFAKRYTRIRSVWQQGQPKPSETVEEALRRVLREKECKLQGARARNRREYKYTRRVQILERKIKNLLHAGKGNSDAIKAWRWMLQVIRILDVDGMSSDESAVEERGGRIEKVFRSKVLRWRRKMERFLDLVDDERTLDTDLFSSRGSKPTPRRRKGGNSRRAVPRGLPLACYRKAWLQSKDERWIRHELQPSQKKVDWLINESESESEDEEYTAEDEDEEYTAEDEDLMEELL